MINEYIDHDTMEQLEDSGYTLLNSYDCDKLKLAVIFRNEMLKYYSEDEITEENIKKFQKSMNIAMICGGRLA